MNHLHSLVLAITLLVGSVSVATAQDFDKGVEAYNAGDYQTALRELRPLAEQGVAIAQFNLGVMYDKGQGVPQYYAEAVRWYRLAAEQGDADAQFNLGVIYNNGRGVPQDYAEAVRWYRLAAEQGDADAQTNLGVMYTHGKGVVQDSVLAHMWSNIGAANGDELGGTNRDSISVGITKQAIEQAQQMARDCMSSNYQNCGFDLPGGAQLLAEVKVEQVYEMRMHSLWPVVRDTLAAQRDVVGFIRRESSVADELRVSISQPDGMDHALELVRGLAQQVVSVTGVGQADIAVRAVTDTDMIITLTDAEKLASDDRTVRQALEIVRRRMDEMGMREPSIQRQGATRILIQGPGARFTQEVKDIIGTIAQLGIHAVVGSTADPKARAGPGNMVIPSLDQEGLYYIVERTPIVTGEELLESQPTLGQNNKPALAVRLNRSGARALSNYTFENIGLPLAVVLDNEVVSVPTIQSHIAGGRVIITGLFSVDEATKLAVMLRSGALPTELDFLN